MADRSSGRRGGPAADEGRSPSTGRPVRASRPSLGPWPLALGLEYLDTGAMYRAVTFGAMRRGVDPDDIEPVVKVARDLELRMGDGRHGGGRRGGRHHRDPGSRGHPGREHRGRQPGRARPRCAGASASGRPSTAAGVMEGRDIGTVVFPDAELKVYLDAVARGPGLASVQGGRRPGLRDGRRRSGSPRRARSGPRRLAAARGQRRRRHRHERPQRRRRSSMPCWPTSTRHRRAGPRTRRDRRDRAPRGPRVRRADEPRHARLVPHRCAALCVERRPQPTSEPR